MQVALASHALGFVRIETRRAASISKAARAASNRHARALQLASATAATVTALIESLPYRASVVAIADQAAPERASASTAASRTTAALSSAFANYMMTLGRSHPFNSSYCALSRQRSVADDSRGMPDFTRAAAAARRDACRLRNTGNSKGGCAAAVRADALQELAAQRTASGLHGSHFGYSDHDITSHPQFRLVAALRAAGVTGTVAANNALALGTVNDRCYSVPHLEIP